MFLDLGLFINLALLVGGLLWCREMFPRWRRDLDEFRGSKDESTRLVLVILRGVTAVVVVLLINFFVGILVNLGIP